VDFEPFSMKLICPDCVRVYEDCDVIAV